MENKSHALAAGAFVLAVTALLVAMAMWLTRDKGVTQPFELSTRDTVTGLQPQAAVRFKGVSVGRVTDIGFDPHVAGNVLIRIAVDSNAPLTPTTFATLSYQGITGLAFIQLDDEGKKQETEPKGSSGIPRLPLRTSQLGELSARVPELMSKVEEVSERVNQLLSDTNQKNFAKTLEGVAASAASINKITQSLDHTLTQRVDPALAALPALVNDSSNNHAGVAGRGQRRVAHGGRIHGHGRTPQWQGRPHRPPGRRHRGPVAGGGHLWLHHPATAQPRGRRNLTRRPPTEPHRHQHQRQPAVPHLRQRRGAPRPG